MEENEQRYKANMNTKETIGFSKECKSQTKSYSVFKMFI